MKKIFLAALVFAIAQNASAITCKVGENLNKATLEKYEAIQKEAAQSGGGLENVFGIMIKISMLAGVMNIEGSTLTIDEKSNMKMTMAAPNAEGINESDMDIKKVLLSYENFQKMEAAYAAAPKTTQDIEGQCEAFENGVICKDSDTNMEIDTVNKTITMIGEDSDVPVEARTMFKNKLICD